MIRILHLLDTAADFQSRRAVEHLSRDLGPDFQAQVLTLGRAGDFRSIPHAIVHLRRNSSFDLLHAHGLCPLAAAALASPARLLFSPANSLTHSTARWLRAISAYREFHTLTSSAMARRSLVQGGLPLSHCHLIRPGVDFSRIQRRRSRDLRQSLGLADDDYVLLAAGESTPAASHRHALWAAAILHVLDPRYKFLLWGRGSRIPQLLEFNRRLANPRLLRIAESQLRRRVEFEELLPAADMILVSATGSVPTLPIAIAMAAALPIISTVSYTTSELLEDRHTALMLPRAAPRLMAQKILALREDPNLQWALADMARTESYEYFSLSRFLNQHRTAYRQLAAAQPLAIPEPAPGAGLRFHGRA